MVDVSILIPARNEEDFIRPCLDSILATEFDKTRLEIIVIDGASDDKTVEILNSFDWQGVSHTILLNPEKNVSTSLNMGIRKSSGNSIIRMDAHTSYNQSYIGHCINLLEKGIAANVGGPMIVKSTTLLDHAIAAATSSVFGIGNSSFHFENYEGYVETVYLGAFKKSIFEKIGLFDEELVRNQDDELNYRIIKAGEKIYMSPKIKSLYHPRSSLARLISQYFQYGFWKVRVIQKHGAPASFRHLVPVTFILIILIAGTLSFLSFFRAVLLLIVFTYFSGCFYSMISIHKKRPLLSLFYLPIIFPCLHFSYGFGFIYGIIKFTLVNKK